MVSRQPQTWLNKPWDNKILRVLLYLLLATGTWTTWGRSFCNQYVSKLIYTSLHDYDFTLSGTSEPLRRKFTGIYWPLDFDLGVTILFFWESITGIYPSFAMFCVYFSPQFMASTGVLMIDSYRKGNQGKAKLRAWPCLQPMQSLGSGCYGPVIAIVFLCSSPLFTESLPTPLALEYADPTLVAAIPVAMTIGWIIPTVILGLPMPAKNRELALAAWLGIPIYITIIPSIIRRIERALGVSRGNISQRDAYLQAAHRTYAFLFAVSSVMHITVVALSICSVLFPMMFAPDYATSLRPNNVFVPFVSLQEIAGLGPGAYDFLLWDFWVGIPTLLLLPAIRYLRIMSQLDHDIAMGVFVLEVIGGSLLVGPGSVMVLLNWAGDNALFTKSKTPKVNGKGKLMAAES